MDNQLEDSNDSEDNDDSNGNTTRLTLSSCSFVDYLC